LVLSVTGSDIFEDESSCGDSVPTVVDDSVAIVTNDPGVVPAVIVTIDQCDVITAVKSVFSVTGNSLAVMIVDSVLLDVINSVVIGIFISVVAVVVLVVPAMGNFVV
jgi:hypothetical protein